MIDFCLTKSLYCDDEQTQYKYLKLEWASIANLKQRSGRVGRVSDGTCFRLIAKDFLKEFSEFQKPAILKQPLDSLILRIKRFSICAKMSPKQVLSMAIEAPDLRVIEYTILNLKLVNSFLF